MKLIFTALFVTCFAANANAQIIPNLLQNQLESLKVLSNIDLIKLTLPNLVQHSYLSPGLKGMLPLTFLQKEPNLTSNSGIVYSNMPVAKLYSGDEMPVAGLSPAGYTMLVKQIAVVNSLAPDVQLVANP